MPDESIDYSDIPPITNFTVGTSLRDLVARSQPHKSTEEDSQWLSMKNIGKEVVW